MSQISADRHREEEAGEAAEEAAEAEDEDEDGDEVAGNKPWAVEVEQPVYDRRSWLDRKTEDA